MQEPKAPEGRAGLANLVMDGSANLVSGLYLRSGRYMPCDKCPLTDCPERTPGQVCGFETRHAEARLAQVMALPHIEPVDLPTVQLMIATELRLDRVSRYLAAAGELLPGFPQYLEFQPVAREWGRLVNTWRGLASQLALSPVDRKRLAATGEGGPGAVLAAVFAEAEALKKAQSAATVDGDFTAEEPEQDPLGGDV